jgi:wobble nucleotide-excising tRNase
MDKKKDICNQLNISLDSCNQALTATLIELEVTQVELNDSSLKLQGTENSCAEKEHLIEKHVHTEHKLTTQAGSVLAIDDMASSDLRSVEDVNQEVRKKIPPEILTAHGLYGGQSESIHPRFSEVLFRIADKLGYTQEKEH